MSIPIRCFSCGVVTGNLWERFVENLQAGMKEGCALEELGLKRACCKRMLMTHAPLIDQLLVRYAIDPHKREATLHIGGSVPSRPTATQLRRMPPKGPLCPL